MNTDLLPNNLTFSFLLTAAGAGVAAAIITGTVQLVKVAMPALADRINGAGLAFIFSAVLFVLAGIAVGVDSLDEALIVFVAWLTCATAAVGVYSSIQTARGK